MPREATSADASDDAEAGLRRVQAVPSTACPAGPSIRQREIGVVSIPDYSCLYEANERSPFLRPGIPFASSVLAVMGGETVAPPREHRHHSTSEGNAMLRQSVIGDGITLSRKQMNNPG
jgi:hypothetical protein